MKNCPTVLTVVAGALVRGDGRILMHCRPLAAMHGGLWEFPGGKVESGESPKLALVRELREELGIDIDSAAAEPVCFAADEIVAGSQSPPIVILLYTIRRWEREPRCIEGEAIGWFAAQELAGLAMPPLDIPLAKRLGELLQAGVI